MMNDPEFSAFVEAQYARQWWLWVLVLVLLVTLVMSGYALAFRSPPAGTVGTGVRGGPMSVAFGVLLVVIGVLLPLLTQGTWRVVGGIGLMGLGLLVPLFLYNLQLATTVEAAALHVRLWPLLERRIPLGEIEEIQPRTYHPIGEFGGWGVRRGPSGTAYNMAGNQGVQLVLHSGERLLIGSQKPEELAAALRKQRNRD